MRRLRNIVTCFTILTLICISQALSVEQVRAKAAGEGGDRTLSPYFFVKGSEDDGARLPLRETSAVVNVAGIIAHVKVTQVYVNNGTTPIEAIYVFPGSTRAAVHGMRMTIGERVRVAKIKERKVAKAEYTKAKKEGKSASLLEQQRPNVFQMSVANIMPGDEITVELFYTENLVPVEGVYEFAYPTVVGPRYSEQPKETAPKSEHWIENPYLFEGEPPTYNFDIEVFLAAGIPLQEVASPSHRINIDFEDEGRATVSLDPGEREGGNRDYILRYRLAGGTIESGLLLFEGEDENFFLLTMEPPRRVVAAQIPPREYIYIVDVSGSMNGFPLTISKKLIKDLVSRLRPADRFNVLLFAAGSRLLAERSLPASPENIRSASHLIDGQQGGGGTRLLPALRRALALPHEENISRTIIIATDGYVSVEREAFDVIRNSLREANVFAFGIGSSVNRYLIEGMARAGRGEPFIVTEPGEASRAAERFRRYIEKPVLTNIELDFDGFDAYGVEPPALPDILAERPVVIFGKFRDTAQGTVTVRGITGEGTYEKTLNVADFTPRKDNEALKYLWARHRIRTLSDYERLEKRGERRKEITDLGLRYSLLTSYTSFIAVDEVVRNTTGDSTKVKQPLPLPKGVSNLAVGGSVPTVPEPEEYALMAVVGMVLLWVAWSRRRRFAFLPHPDRGRE
jgi:Ca-activated chloride channel family protein